MHDNLRHHPVMVDEVLSYLKTNKAKIYIDCTFGQGGYSQKLLENIDCKIIGIDRDKEAQKYAIDLKKSYPNNFFFFKDTFGNIERVLRKIKIKEIDGVILDLGLSNTQLNDPERGFSFLYNGPLDMRMDQKDLKITAKQIINNFNQKQLSDIFYHYGDEKNSRKIARKIIESRKKRKISTTFELVELIKSINKHKKKHPATRVFQALRIYINDELNELDFILSKSLLFMRKKSRIITVAFHSLEDRIVKNFFSKNKNYLRVLTKKPLSPSQEEIKNNPRSRSAKMRVAEIL